MKNKLSDFFSHCEKLPVVALITGGRTGSDFFQSLTDGHPEILQLTGITWFHDEFWIKSVCKNNLNDLINQLIYHNQMICKFKSKYNKQERWHMLGESKNENFIVSIPIFKRLMLKILDDKEINSKNFFIAFHLAYAIAKGERPEAKKLIFIHIHHIERLAELLKDFRHLKVIFTTRDPRNNLVSGLDHHRAYSNYFGSKAVYYWISRVFYEAMPLEKLIDPDDIKILTLESLHKNSYKIMNEFCHDFNLCYDSCLLESSYHGKQWWGDALSKKLLRGFNEGIDKPKWKSKIYFYENLIIEFLLSSRLIYYGYSINSKINSYKYAAYIIVPILILLPTKYEIRGLFYEISKVEKTRKKIKPIINFAGMFSLRVVMQLNFYIKKINGSVKNYNKYGACVR